MRLPCHGVLATELPCRTLWPATEHGTLSARPGGIIHPGCLGDQEKFSAISALLSHFASSHQRPVGCGFESHSFATGDLNVLTAGCNAHTSLDPLAQVARQLADNPNR
jgi:hypothetical protein